MDKKEKWNIIYLLINLGILAFIAFSNPEIKNIPDAINRINIYWILGGFLFTFLFWAFDALALRDVTNFTSHRLDFNQAFKVTMVGKYYTAITPLGSGSQPAQIVYMGKYGVPAGLSVSMLMIKFWVHQIGMGIFAIIAFIMKGRFIKSYSPIMFGACIVGFIFSMGGPLFLYILSAKEGLLNTIFDVSVKFLKKKNIIKEDEHFTEKIADNITQYSNTVRLLRANRKSLIRPFFVTILELPCYLGIPYFIYRSCGFSSTGMWDFILVNIFLYFAVSFVPTPGAAGASEGGFFALFDLFFPKDYILLAMLLWRLLSYYAMLIVGGCVILVDTVKKR